MANKENSEYGEFHNSNEQADIKKKSSPENS
jgi:hypothetical protein